MSYRFDWERWQELHADDPPCEHVAQTVRRSRKERTCATCGGTIKVGERYTRDFWIIDGDPDVLIAHEDPYCYMHEEIDETPAEQENA